MNLIKKALFVLTLVIAVQAQNYKQVKIFTDDLKDVAALQALGLEFDHPHASKDNSIEVFLNESEFQILKSSSFRYEIMIDDWKAYYDAQPKLSSEEIQRFAQESREMYGVEGFHLGTMGGYMTLAELNAELDTLKNQFSSLITTKQAVGYSIENRPIFMVKISDNPNVDENEPEILYTALHHAREPQGMMQMFYFMYYLLENYTTNPAVQYLVNNREMYFIPCINPDGYEYNRSTNPSGGGMWRKNRRVNTGGSYGVDLNRNYGPYNYWNAPNGGSSTSPSSDTYRGTAPFSEPETVTIRDFLASRKIKNALNYHTYSNLLIYPYGALSRETPDSLIFREYAADMTRYNGYTTGTDMQTVGYSTRGNSDDYFYDGDTLLSGGKIFAMTPEVGSSSDGFWPPQSRIFPLAQENVHPNLYYAWVSGEYVSLDNPNFTQSYFNPGNIVQLFPRLKNKGLSTGYNLQLMMTSLSSYATINSGSTNVDSIKSRMTSTSINPLSFTISSTTPVETKIKLLFTTLASGAVMSQDTVSIIVGYPEFIFIDTTGNPLIYWTVTEPLSRPFWEATTASYYSSPNCYTDSKSGNYINSDTVTMTMTNPINLSSYTNPKLSFWTKYDIENNWDYGQVEISTNNGITWTALAGAYTNLGTGSFQPNGQPLYDGTQTNWVREEISLAGYTSSQVKLRFKLRTDGSVQRDGWYVDDIGIVVYTSSNIQLTALIEGFYNGTTMNPDTVLVQLRNSASPYALAEQKQLYLNSSGQGNGLFKNMSETSSYYLVVKHRNSIETWSAAPQSFISGVLSYDFTTAQNKAYGNNLVEKGTKWCIYSGEITDNFFIDYDDLIQVYNFYLLGLENFGYYIEDVTGNGFVEFDDVLLVYNNYTLGIWSQNPLNPVLKRTDAGNKEKKINKGQ